ncbi:hypothetical protein PTKIN_Ptkin12aG0013800 [Pterospermum kingtungense]
MEEEFDELLNRVSPDEGEELEGEVFVDEQWVSDDKEVGVLILIGRLVLRKPYNIKAMHNALMRVWHLETDVEIREVGACLFLFKSTSPVDKAKVLFNQPWMFNKFLLVFSEFHGDEVFTNVVIDHCSFWVQLLGASTNLLNQKVRIVIGYKPGRVEKVEAGDDRWSLQKRMRIRVSLNILKLLKKGMWLSVSDGKRCWVMFRYEQLPDFCYVCGCWITLSKIVLR